MFTGIGLIGVAFWVFMAAVVIAEEVGDTKRRRADLELVRFAIERGQPLTPDVVQQILARSKTSLYTSGIVTAATGIGIVVFALLLSRITTNGGWAVSGIGCIVICVGIGLVISHKLTRSNEPAPVTQS
jgi:Domain of unknown function (DUF6249)